jgi:UDP-N-acetylglucosamine 2-epimerase (non-hydrolysing)
MTKKMIMFVFGTRPEAIKMFPVIKRIREEGNFRLFVVATGQQREMLQQTLKSLKILVDLDLDLMTDNQSLASLTSKLFNKLDEVIKNINPHYLLIHGDTTTSMVAGILGKYHKVKVFHLEAGLRSNDIYSPWPEEMNRKINSVSSDYHFAPTNDARRNLLLENVSGNDITVTGNTGIDTLRILLKNQSFFNNLDIQKKIDKISDKKIILITIHRRENFSKLEEIFSAIKNLAALHHNVEFIYPVHLNPNVNVLANKILIDIDNLLLTNPLDYIDFIQLLDKSFFVITDSGGIQEEATYLGKPIVLCRDTTERPEGLKTNNIILTGTNTESILLNCIKLITDHDFYLQHAVPSKVFGDGYASEKISAFIEALENN